MANERARAPRARPSDAESKLWTILRRRQLAAERFRRQAPIGRYIVDFVCLERKLVVEVDGGQHVTAPRQDAARTARRKSQGFRVLRFWNNEVLANIEGVTATIRDALQRT